MADSKYVNRRYFRPCNKTDFEKYNQTKLLDNLDPYYTHRILLCVDQIQDYYVGNQFNSTK